VARERYRPIGWPEDRAPRRQPNTFARLCATSFGDSFTYGDEVADDETWPYFLSVDLNCEVRNFGYSAYGLDQAVLRYEQERPATKVVLLGLYVEMIRRDLAASWVFYAGPDAERQKDNLPEYYCEKPYFILRKHRLVQVPLPSEPVTHTAL